MGRTPTRREQAAFPAPWMREHKFWPAVGAGRQRLGRPQPVLLLPAGGERRLEARRVNRVEPILVALCLAVVDGGAAPLDRRSCRWPAASHLPLYALYAHGRGGRLAGRQRLRAPPPGAAAGGRSAGCSSSTSSGRRGSSSCCGRWRRLADQLAAPFVRALRRRVYCVFFFVPVTFGRAAVRQERRRAMITPPLAGRRAGPWWRADGGAAGPRPGSSACRAAAPAAFWLRPAGVVVPARGRGAPLPWRSATRPDWLQLALLAAGVAAFFALGGGRRRG